MSTDPVVARRALISKWVERARRAGYLMFAAAVVLFVVGFIIDFSPLMVTVISALLFVGTVVLAPAIVLHYGVAKAEREDPGR
ncbi:MAG TPA: hypothetical protein ENI86_12475 [Acidimicrobiales bacterium]|nr:hypothetical protein [Acidimicrobiales bacterium]